MTQALDDAVLRLSAITGLPLERCTIAQLGISAQGARVAGVEAGRGLVIALSRTITSTTAVVMPEDSGGALVRRLGRWAQDNADAWRAAVEEVNAQGVQLTISVNHEMLDDPREAPGGLWRAFSIECWARMPARTSEEIQQSLIKVGGPALALALNGLVEQDEVELPSFEPLPEGAVTTIKVNRYERNPVNRLRCISHYGTACWVCGLDFAEYYGPAAAGFIEVHHRIPVSAMGEGYLVDPIVDLVPLCSNCHSVAHRRTPPYQPSEIRELLGLPPKVPALPVVQVPPSSDGPRQLGIGANYEKGPEAGSASR